MRTLTGPRLAAGAAGALAAILATSALATGGAAASSTGAGHPAAAAGGGTLVAWGDNSSAQLGDGTVMDRDAPVQVQVKSGTMVTSVRAGCFNTVALTRSGLVLDWGRGELGQLGNGTTQSSAVPVQVKLPTGTKVTAVRAGCNYELALTRSGRVLAWGQNPADQFGAAATRAVSVLPAPVTFPAGTKVTAISAGAGFALALTAGHRVYAWGDDSAGELGNGRTKNSRTPVRVHLPAGVKVTSVAAGEDFALARTGTGGMLAWGDDFKGYLGDGRRNTIRKLPARVSLPGGARVEALAAGCFHAIASTAAGGLLAWGDNSWGQLGDNSTTVRTRPVPVQLPPGTTVKAFGAECNDSMALNSAGQVLTWGNDNAGELGTGTVENPSPVPVQVTLPPNTRATGIAAGSSAGTSGFAIVVPAP